MKSKSLFVLLITAILIFGVVFSSSAKFPDGKSIEIVVPYGAGGSSDQLARAIDMVADKYFDVPVVITNMSGGGGTLGFKHVVDAKPDGHVLLISYGTGSPDMVGDHVVDLPYDPIEDFIPVCMMSRHAIILSAHVDSGIKSLEDVKKIGEERGGITVGIAGPVLFRIPVKVLSSYFDFEMTPVSFGGGSSSIAALLGRHCDLTFNHPSEVCPHIEAGKVIPLAICLDEREPLVSDIPTFKELGYEVPEIASVKGIAVPKGTPQEAISYLAEKFEQISKDADFIKKMKELTQPINYLNQEEFTKYVDEIYNRFGELVKEFDIK